MKIFSAELTVLEEEFDEVTLGFNLIAHPDSRTEQEHMFVEPRWFRQGVGSILLKAALSSAQETGIEEIAIISDPNAVGPYQKHGAVIVGEHQTSTKERTLRILKIGTAL